MGIFGEAIYGHIGQYRARVYNACYMQSEDGRVQLVNTEGLTEQDTLNRIFGNISIGPQNDSSIVLSLNVALKRYSWAVRMAPQAGSAVSGGYCHAVHCESSLSSLYMIDSFLYFPFIPDGEYCASMIRNPESFTAQKRWRRSMQMIRPMQEQYNNKLGRSLNIPRDLMKRLTSYIVSQASVNARQYLYIRVPDGAPYEAYCLAALHDILTCIPAGLRAGILAATNCIPQEEQNFGIIFQRASFPASHPTDISLHVNAEYPFLSNVFVSASLKSLLDQIVDYPELTDKCFRTMEQEVFGDKLPDSYQSYENYYGISTIQKNQDRPSYLEECSNLLGMTTEPVLKSILEKIILDEYRTSQDLEAAISRDPLFNGVRTFTDLSGYLKKRNNILTFLASHGIRYSKLFIYRHLNSIALGAGAKNVIDLYDKIISEQRELEGFSDSERSEILADCRREAWDYFAKIRSAVRNEEEKQAAGELYGRLTALDTRVNPDYRPPVSERNWYNSCQRSALLNRFRISRSPELAEQILSIPDYDQKSENITCLTRESLELIRFLIEKMEEMNEKRPNQSPNQISDLETVRIQINEIVRLDDVVSRFFGKWKAFIPTQNLIEENYRRAFESTLYRKAVEYTRRSDLTGDNLNEIIEIVSTRMPVTGTSCIQEIERFVADIIRRRQVSWRSSMELYRAACVKSMDSDLQKAYSDLVASEIRLNTLMENNIRELYQTVQNPDSQLQRQYMEWSENTSRTKEYLEKMKASKTLIKYLNLLLQSNNNLAPQDISNIRSDMWNQLDFQERTISAFTASVTYLYQCSSEMIYNNQRLFKESEILKKECRILAKDFGLGIYLDPDLSISELYENLRLFKLWTNMENVVLYSKKDLRFSKQKTNTDSSGELFCSIPVSAELMQDTLKRLLWILDGEDYAYPGGKEVDLQATVKDFSASNNHAQIMKLLDAAGILDNNPNLIKALKMRGFQREGRKTAESGIQIDGIRKCLKPAVVLLLTFIVGAVLSHIVWPQSAITQVSSDNPEIASGPDVIIGAEGGNTKDTQDFGGGNTDENQAAGGSNTGNTSQGEKTDAVGATSTGESKEESIESGEAKTTEAGSSGNTLVSETTSGLKAPSLRYEGDDPELKYAWSVFDQVKKDNNTITAIDNQILLPGKAAQVYSKDENQYYLVVKYCRWTYQENEKDGPILVIEKPESETFLGVIKMRRVGPESWKYDKSVVWMWDQDKTIPEEVREGYPETVEKLTDFYNKGLEYDEIKEGVSGCLKGLDKPIKKVYYLGKSHRINNKRN